MGAVDLVVAVGFDDDDAGGGIVERLFWPCWDGRRSGPPTAVEGVR